MKCDPNETLGMGCDAILLAIYGVIQSLGTDERARDTIDH
jgi:hypothetical protein